jgi:DNA-binding NtrC family response regulator
MEDPMNAPDLTDPQTPSSNDSSQTDSGYTLETVEMLQAAQTDACLLLTGFTDARSLALRIHRLSKWRWSPFVVVDCGWPEPLLEELLFGVPPHDMHAEGAGSAYRLLGSGTIFLHEVGRLRHSLQARLLEVLAHTSTQGKSRFSRKRVISSTSERLWQRIVDGTFDDRLFYRLNAIHFVEERTHG